MLLSRLLSPAPLLPLLVLAPASTAADHWVGPAGSGAPFQKIQHAVDAAQPGDRVLVMPGEYNGHVVVDKAIELLGSGSGATSVQPIQVTYPGDLPSALVVTGIPAGSRVSIAGLRLLTGLSLHVSPPLQVVDCAGRVEITDVHLDNTSNPPNFPHSFGLLTVRDAAQVVLTAVTTAPSSLDLAPGTEYGFSGAGVTRSTVWFNRCDLMGQSDARGGHGLHSVESSVHLSASSFTGGQSPGIGTFLGGPEAPGPGGAGLVAEGSHVRVHGGNGNLLKGADAVEVMAFGEKLGFAGDAVDLDGTSSITLAADTVLVPGAPTASFPAGQALDAEPGAAVIELERRLPTLFLSPAIAPPGSPVVVEMQGEPGSVQIRGLAFTTSAAFAVPGVSGSLLLDPASLMLLPAVALDGTGSVSVASALPPGPGIAGLSIVEQTVQITAAALDLSPPTILSIGI